MIGELVQLGQHLVSMGTYDSDLKADLEGIQRAVEEWLNRIWPLEQGVRLAYTLDIKGQRQAGDVTEVCLRTAIGGKSKGLEVRVPLPDTEECAICVLHCVDSPTMVEIYGRARPKALIYITRKRQEDAELADVMRHGLDLQSRKTEKVLLRQDRAMGHIWSNGKFAELAFYLHHRLAKKPVIDHGDVLAAVRDTIGAKVRKEVLPLVLQHLVDEAVLEPDLDEKKAICFKRGIYLADLLGIHRKSLRRAEIERLEKEIVARNKNLSEQQRLREEREKQLAEVDDRIARILADIGAKEARLKELEGEDD